MSHSEERRCAMLLPRWYCATLLLQMATAAAVGLPLLAAPARAVAFAARRDVAAALGAAPTVAAIVRDLAMTVGVGYLTCAAAAAVAFAVPRSAAAVAVVSLAFLGGVTFFVHLPSAQSDDAFAHAAALAPLGWLHRGLVIAHAAFLRRHWKFARYA